MNFYGQKALLINSTNDPICLSCFSLDATKNQRIGKFVNDSNRTYSNAWMRKVKVNGKPRLCLYAKKNIDPKTEIRYDYGEHPSLLPWRKEVIYIFLKNNVKEYIS